MPDRHESPTPLTPAVFQTLLALAGGVLHGYAIAQEVERATDGQVRMGPGTLYGTLQRLQELGYIKERPSPSTADGAHEARRRYYGLTGEGRDALEADLKRLDAVVDFARRKLAAGSEE